MPHAYRKQPIRTIYLTLEFLALLFVRLPVWFIQNLPRSVRPRTTWSLTRSVMVNVIRRLMYISGQAGDFKGSGKIDTWVEPANHLITGNLKRWAQIAGVSSIHVPGNWTLKPGINIKPGSPAGPGEKVILQFHGGGYISHSTHPSTTTDHIAEGYVKELDSIQRVFSLQYRLASDKPFAVAHPFPTQLLDALAGYNYVVNDLGFRPENIVISGDSAGGNLALALTRYLTEYEDSSEVELPGPPGAIVLICPWVDLGQSTQAIEGGSATKYLSLDYIGQPGGDGAYAVAAFRGPHGQDILDMNPYISPVSLDPRLEVDFKKFPPTFIVAGGAEILYDSIVILRDRMIKDIGGRVSFYEARDAVHDYLVFTWHEPERTNTLKEINRWLKML